MLGTRDIKINFSHEIQKIIKNIISIAQNLTIDYADTDNNEQIVKIQSDSELLNSEVNSYLSQIAENDEESNLSRNSIFNIIYDLLIQIQGIKRNPNSNNALLSDIKDLHNAVNSLTDLFEGNIDSDNIKNNTEMVSKIFAAKKQQDRKGRILVVDDDPFIRKILARQLERQGHSIFQAADGREALTMLHESPFDIVILDMMMPGMNGFQFLEAIREEPLLSNISTIVISALNNSETIARCIELGAEDYLPRDFDPIILRARINSILEKKAYKQENDEALSELVETQDKLAAELREAASYVRSLLPKRAVWKNVTSDWEFIPSISLGGDCFYYHDIDENRMAIYLMDVSGHGIQAALLSASIMNMLRSMTLGGIDYSSPASVLKRLNNSFHTEDQNNMFFTVWYGVYDNTTNILKYASAGSHPTILINGKNEALELIGDGPVIGIDDNAVFSEFEEVIEPNSDVYLFSDGLFEIHTKDGQMLSWNKFEDMLIKHHNKRLIGSPTSARDILNDVRAESAKSYFDDDVSIVTFSFK